MYITNEDFSLIEKALSVLTGDTFKNLTEEQQEMVLKADVAMVHLLKKKKRDNARQKLFMAEKRKSDKFYGRRLYVHKNGTLGYK